VADVAFPLPLADYPARQPDILATLADITGTKLLAAT